MSPNITNSTTVDERVVEMRIDNSKFEDGAKKTIGILEKLDKALHLHAETDEIDKLNNAIGKFDVSPMANGLDSLQSHFSALEIMGMRVISNLTDSVYNFTTRTIKDFTIAPVMQGWEKFGDKTTAVATLKAQGYELEKVNKLMEDLNWFTDETSYNFTDMVGNIAKFTATGQDLDSSVTAMEGIALWAALSGQNATKASMAMYQLSQAMGKGALKYDDYKSIQNASMDTIEFRQQAVAAAEAVGKLKKVGEDTWAVVGGGSKDEAKALKLQRQIRDAEVKRQYAQERLEAATTDSSMRSAKQSVEQLDNKIQDLNEDLASLVEGGTKGAFTLSELFSSDALSRQLWFTDEVMMSVFNNYSKGVKEIQRYMDDNNIDTASIAMQQLREEAEDLAQTVGITLDEAFKQLGYDIDEFSLKAFEAGQQARTWKDVVDSVKDAVSTGWMNTFEIIFGNADKATKFWTNMSNQFWNLFASGGESRNSILKVAMGTADSIKEIAEYVSENTSFSPKTGEAVQEFDKVTSSIKTMQDTAKATPLAWSDITKSLDALGASGWELGNVLSEIESFTKPGTIFDNQLGGIKWDINNLEKAFNSGTIGIQDFQAAIAVLNDESYLPVLRNWLEKKQVGDFTWSDMDEKSMQKELNIIAEYLVKFGRDTEMHAKMQEAWNKGWNEHWDLSRWKNAIENAEQNVQEFSNLSAWDKLQREINQNGKTLEDFQEELNNILYENKSVELNALIEKYGSLEAALKSGEIEAGEFYDALVKLRSGDSISDAAEEIEQATHSLEELKEVAWGVLRGDYGNGEDRKRALEALGYNYDLVQGIAEIMNNGGQGYIAVTEDLLRNEYPTFYAMMQEQIALNGEYADTWDTIINSEEDAANLLNEFQNDISDSSSFSPKTDGAVEATETALDRALAPYQMMLGDLEDELIAAYREYEDVEREIALHGIAGHEGELQKIAARIEDITSQIDSVTKKLQLIKRIDILSSIDVSGWELFTGSINRILDILVKIKETADEAMENVFGDYVERGLKLQLALGQFHNFVEQITFSEEAIDGVRNVFEGFFTVIKIGRRVVGIATKLFGNFFIVAVKLLDKIFGFFGRFNSGGLISIIDTVLDSLSNGVDLIFDIIHSLLDGKGFSDILASLGDGFTILLTPLLGLFSIGESIVNFFSGLFSKISEMVDFDAVLSSIANTLQVFGLAIAGLIGTPLYGLFTVITNFFTAIKNGASSLYNMAKNSEVVQGIISSLATGFTNFSKTMKRLKNSFDWGYLSGGFLGGFEAFWQGLKSEFSTTFPTLYNVLSNFFGIFASGWHLVSSAFDDIKNFFSGENLQGLFDSTLGFFASIPQFVGNGLKGIGALFAVIFGGITRVVTGVINSLEGAKINTDKIEESFNEFYEIVKLVFNGIFGDPTELKERVTNFVLNVWEGFKEAIGQISLWDAVKAFRTASLLALLAKISSVIGNIKRVTYEVSSIPEAITNAIGKGSLVFDDIGKSFRANAMIKLAVALVMVATALYGLSRINEEKLTHAATIVSLVMIVLTLIVNSLNKNQRFREVNIHHNLRVFDTVGSALIGLGIALAAITFAIVKLEKIAGSNTFIGAAVTVGIIIAVLATIVGLFLNALLKTKMYSEGLKVVGKTISKLGGAMLLMSLAVSNLVLPVLAFTAVAAYLENKGLDNARWIVWGSAIAIAGLIAVLGLGIKGIINALSGFSEGQLRYVGGAMLKIAASMYVFAMALGRFMRPFFLLAIVSALIYDGTDKSLEPIWTALEVVTGMLFILGALLAGLTFLLSRDSLSEGKIKEVGNAMLKIGATVALLGIGMKKFVFAMLEIVAAIAVLKKLGASDKTIDNIFGTALRMLAHLSFMIVALVAAFSMLSAIPSANFGSLIGMAAIITALGVAFLFITPAIMVLAIAIGVLVGALSKMTNADETIQRIKDITSALVWIAIAAAAFGGAILMIGAGAIKFALAIGIVALAVLALAGAFVLVSEYQDGIIKFFKRFFNFFKLSKSKAKSFGSIALGIVAFTVAIGGLFGILKLISKGFRALRIISSTESFGKRFSKSLGSLRTTLLGGLKNTFISVQTFLTDPKNIGTITQALGVVITTVGLYLAGVIPTFTETVVTSFITLVQSLSASIQVHRQEFSTAISDAINTLFAIVGDVFKEVFLNPESWAEGGLGGGIVRVLFGLFLTAKVLQAIKAIGTFIGGLFGLSFGKKAAAEVVTNIVGGTAERTAVEAAATGLGETAGAAAKAGFLAKFASLATDIIPIVSTIAAIGFGWHWLSNKISAQSAEYLENIGLGQNADAASMIEVQKSFQTRVDKLKELTDALNNPDIAAFSQYTDAIKLLADSANITFEEAMQNIKEWRSVTGTDGYYIQKYYDDLILANQRLADYLGISSDQFEKDLEKYGSVTAVFEAYNKKIEEAQSAIQDLAPDEENKMEVDVSVDDTEVQDWLSNIAGIFKDVFSDPTKGAIQDAIDSIVEQVSAANPGLTKENLISQATSGITSWASEAGIDLSQYGDVTSMVTEAVNNTATQFGSIADTATEAVTRMATINDNLGTMQDELESSIKHLHSRHTKTGDGSVTAEKGEEIDALGPVGNTNVVNLQSAWEAAGKSIPEALARGISANAYLAINAITQMSKNIQTPFQRITDIFRNFGVQAVRGVVIGINNNVSAAYNAGVNLANAVNRGYTNTLKIKSPSRVFEELSMYVPIGAANGITKGIPIAVAAASDLANAIADEAAHAMSNMAYVASDNFDFRPTITPVIDLTNAYQGMDSLESIFADNPLSTSIRPQNAYRQMPTQATNYTFSNQNRDVVNEIHRLSDLMTQLGEEITNMKIVLNSGVLVGEMAPAMNQRLGTLATRERRQ